MVKKAVNYCKNRDISGIVAKKYCLGYANNSWNALKTYLLKQNVPEKLIEQVGLIKSNNNSYDRFRDRLMFPIKNSKGRVIGFGGRALNDDVKPKYLNSPETKLFSKSKVLYGLYEARQNNVDSLVIVEGYTDVISLSQFGINNCVATLGTAVTAEHIKEALRCSKTLLFCLDGDKAGQEAAWRAVKVCLPFLHDGVFIKFLFMPNNLDPDSCIKKIGISEFNKLIAQAIPLSEFILKKISISVENIDTIDGKAILISKIKPMVDSMPNGAFKAMMVKKLERFTGVSANALQIPVVKVPTFKNSKIKFKAQYTLSPAIRIIAILLKYRDLLGVINDCTLFEKVDIMGAKLLSIVIKLLQTNPKYTIEDIKDNISSELQHELSLAVGQSVEFKVSKKELEIDILDALKKIKLYCYDKELEELFAKSRISQSADIRQMIFNLVCERDNFKKTD